MSIWHMILLLYEKTRSLGLNIDSQTSHQTSKGVAIGEKSNTVVEYIFSEKKKTQKNRNLYLYKSQRYNRELNYRSTREGIFMVDTLALNIAGAIFFLFISGY